MDLEKSCLSEQLKLVSLRKKIRNAKIVRGIGNLLVFVGICTVVFMLFNFSNQESRDFFGLWGNVFLFLGLGISFYGFRRETKLQLELNKILAAPSSSA